MEIVQRNFGYHPAFAVAAGGMFVSMLIMWRKKQHLGTAERPVSRDVKKVADAMAVTEDASPVFVNQRNVIDAVPTLRRVGALIVIFLIVIVFWMVFHQSSTTLTYWADENTDWKVSGIISNSINPFWVIMLTFPLVAFWGWLDKKELEPLTPTKMATGMMMTCLAFSILFIAAKTGEASLGPGAGPYAYKVSPLWLLGAYGVLTLGELMLSPMGLSLVSKVAPVRHRGLMMGGWFVATAIGNKLTQIGQLWDDWLHSTFWIFLSACALVMAFLLLILLRPLKKAMPGV
jgi:POT family proton-dependent oligopeptide transporter